MPAARKVIITRRALRDLEAIWEYISDQAGATIASNVIAALLEAMDQLADMPGMGHTRSDVTNPAYRFWAVKSYVIGYRFNDETIRVMRVVHGSRDLGRLFRR